MSSVIRHGLSETVGISIIVIVLSLDTTLGLQKRFTGYQRRLALALLVVLFLDTTLVLQKSDTAYQRLLTLVLLVVLSLDTTLGLQKTVLQHIRGGWH